jgi:hypothetical protein
MSPNSIFLCKASRNRCVHVQPIVAQILKRCRAYYGPQDSQQPATEPYTKPVESSPFLN